jgi:FAD/FMN-containing dehydrogenase
MYSDEEISQMVRVKTALDPGGTLNPGNMLEGP